MKPIKRTLLGTALLGLLLFGSALPTTKAAVTVSVDFFHNHLEPYGDWREVGDYGYCWQPRNVDADWRPYSDGRWFHTDAGWTWYSEEPYSWAVYHYGRWARVAGVGWVWVPGTEWGPAWVSWRHGPRHVGWAPLPPEARFNRALGFGARVDVDFDIGPGYFNFVELRNFGAPRLRTVIVAPRQNITFIHQTTNITRITYVNNVVHNHGPRYEEIARESKEPIRRMKLERREQLAGEPGKVQPEHLKTSVEGDSLRVTAPAFDEKPATAPRKVAAKVEKAEVDRGWKDAGPAAEAAKVRAKIKSEPEPKAGKTGEAPPVTRVPSDVPEKKTTKEKGPNEDPPKVPGKPVNPKDPAEGTKPVVRPSPPTPGKGDPSQPAKPGKKKGGKDLPPPAKVKPPEEGPGAKPKAGNAEAPPKAVEPAGEKVQPGKEAAQGNPDKPAVRKNPRKGPAKPEARPKAAPAAPQPADEKGKDKKKD